jgi:D-alanine-D-alanine ligase
MKIKVGVIFGGESVEHEVSIITAVQAMEFLDKDKYEPIPIYISKDRIWYTGSALKEMDVYRDLDLLKRYTKRVMLIKKDGKYCLQTTHGLFKRVIDTIDIAFPIVHGKGVEDGTMAGLLEQIGIPYVGPKVLGASVGQDKVIQKQILSANNLPVVDYTWFYDYEFEKDYDKIHSEIKKMDFPVIVKPALLGSSIGISVVKSNDELDDAIREAIKYDTKILIEKVVPNLLEVDCAVLGNYERTETSLVGEMMTDNDFLTFEDKYISGGKSKKMPAKKFNNTISTSGFEIPAGIDDKLKEEIYDLSKKAFRALNLSGVTRFDFLVDKKTKKVYINEPNTIPGCLAFFFFTPLGKEYTTLLDEMITLAIKTYKHEKEKITSFESNVLATYGGGKTSKVKMANIHKN